MSTFNLERPSLLRVPDALRASPSSSSSTSTSSSSSYGFDQRSKTSQFSLITPLGSVDSIFGNDQKPVPCRFPDLVPWDGLTDQQWGLHSLASKAECAIKEPEIGVINDLDETFFSDDIWYDDDLCDLDEEFDAVAAVRARLVKGEQTTRHALDIIDTRSGLAPTFELGIDEVLEVLPNNTHNLHRDSQEVDESREQDSLFNETFPSPPHATNFLPSTPLIRPVDVVWDCQTSDSSAYAPLMSPLVLDNPAIFHNSFGNINPIYGSPIVSISPFLFPLPKPVAGLRDSGKGDITPREQQKIGLGLSAATPITEDAGTEIAESQYESRRSHRVRSISKANPIFVGVDSDPKPLYDESVLSFGPALSPLDKMLEGLGQRVVPYVPTTLGSNIPHTRPTSDVVYVTMNTVTAGCSHPAASASFITSTMEASRAQKGIKGLGLGLPMGLKQRLSRCSSGISTSEACQDLASLVAAPVTFKLTNSRPRGFRGPMLSPILEVDDSPQPGPYPTPESRPTPSSTKQRNFFKRAIKFLF